MQGVSKKSKNYGANNLNVHFEHSASAVFRRPGEGWTLSTVKKVCSRVDLTGSAILRKLGSGDLPQRLHAQFVVCVRQFSHW